MSLDHAREFGVLARERALLERWSKKLLEKETLGEEELGELRSALTASLRAA